MSDIQPRRNMVYKSLHKPLTYAGIERRMFFLICVTAAVTFNLFNSLLAGFVVLIGGAIFGYWVTNKDPAFLVILSRSGKLRPRYDAAKQALPNVEIR